MVDPPAELQAAVDEVMAADEAAEAADDVNKRSVSDDEEDAEIAKEKALIDALDDDSHLAHRQEYQKLMERFWGDRGGPTEQEIYWLGYAVSMLHSRDLDPVML